MKLAEAIGKYNRMKYNVLPHCSPVVARRTKLEMKTLRDSIWNTIASTKSIEFANTQELAATISILLDTGKIFGLDWRRRTDSKTDPLKTKGTIGTLTVKKVDGYVKGTDGGKKLLSDIENGRVTLWVSNGTLYSEGYGNWRTIYAEDVTAIKLGKNVCRVN